MINRFTRVMYSFPVYIDPEYPLWVIPNKDTDIYLKKRTEGYSTEMVATAMLKVNAQPLQLNLAQMHAVERSLGVEERPVYQGRAKAPLKQLTEVWIHLTDNCNLACKHCLFGCQPDGKAKSLQTEDVKKWINESYELGCRLVVFTGGEPFVHPDFIEIIKWCQEKEDLAVAVLTNGLLLPNHMEALNGVDKTRLHFQISLDGLEKEHDSIRGKGNYKRALKGLDEAKKLGYSTSVVMAVNEKNVDDMAGMIDELGKNKVHTVHFMWHFVRGAGRTMASAKTEKLISNFKAAVKKARARDINIDNMDAIKSQLFSPMGTRYDLTNAGWESIAIGPDRCVYPTPALIGLEEFNAGQIKSTIEDIWRESECLKKIRSASLLDIEGMENNPWRFVLGGGDLDHAIYNRPEGKLLGTDPYMPLYEAIIAMLLEEEVRSLPSRSGYGLILRMGDVSADCPSGEEINYTHCNCLLSMGEGDHRSLISSFYATRAIQADETILNPVHYDVAEIDFIPEEGRVRQYGCGSPVADAALKSGETVLDLGSGTGVEVFIAAKKVGPRGKALGLDMTDAMLDIANRSKDKVVKNLGYKNVEFIKGFLEEMPVGTETVDVVISNCVINLTGNKRKVFKEIWRILKPGGRLVISDVVTETEPQLKIRADQKMKGECLGGAYVQDYLFAVLNDTGFEQASMIKRFPYRKVMDHMFYSMTYKAVKPLKEKQAVNVLYGGPGKALIMDSGDILHVGEQKQIILNYIDETELAEKGLFIVDKEEGVLLNLGGQSGCCCAVPEEQKAGDSAEGACYCDEKDEQDHAAGCLICGAPLNYLDELKEVKCEKCGTAKEADVLCQNHHFVCDECHAKQPVDEILDFCLAAEEQDLMVLYRNFKAGHQMPVHGPEHHALVPGLILAAYKNAGGELKDRDIRTGIKRAEKIPGGSCGFMGICGSAVGAGIAFGIIQKSAPLNPVPRQSIQHLVAELGLKLAEVEAARCCQREVVTVLKAIAGLSEDYIGVRLTADAGFACEQHLQNAECVGAGCPVFRKK